jgi:hypothetical protein
MKLTSFIKGEAQMITATLTKKSSLYQTQKSNTHIKVTLKRNKQIKSMFVIITKTALD